MKLFHGSPNLFDRFDAAKSETGPASAENGFGINLSDGREIPWEHANGMANGPGVIYSVEIDDAHLRDDWLISNKAIGQNKYDRIVAGSAGHPSADAAADLRKYLTPESTGSEVFALAGLRYPRNTEFIAGCGIGGFHRVGESTFVVFRPDQLSPLQIDQVIGEFPEAAAAHQAQMETGVFQLPAGEPPPVAPTPNVAVDPVVAPPATPAPVASADAGGPRNFRSEELGAAARRVGLLNDAAVGRAFDDLSAALTQGRWLDPAGSGFDARNATGLAVQRLINDKGADDDHWSGRETFKRVRDSLSDHPDVQAKVVALEDALQASVSGIRPKREEPGPAGQDKSAEGGSSHVEATAKSLEAKPVETSVPHRENAIHGGHVAGAQSAVGIGLDLADGNYAKAAQGAVTAAATSQTGLELIGKGLSSAFHVAGNFAKHVPILGAAVTVGFVGIEVAGDMIDGNYGKAAAATLAGTGEAIVNGTGAGLFGGGDAAREAVRFAVGQVAGERYQPDESGLRQMTEQAGDMIARYTRTDPGNKSTIRPVFTAKVEGQPAPAATTIAAPKQDLSYGPR